MFPVWYQQQLLPKITNKTGYCMLSFSSFELPFQSFIQPVKRDAPGMTHTANHWLKGEVVRQK